MPRLRTIQTNFTSGELDPALKARTDVKHYFNGAEYLRNVLVIPQGGAIRRPGLRWIREVHPIISPVDLSAGPVTVTATEGGTASQAFDDDTATEVLTTTNIGTVDPYVILHIDLGSATAILFADVEGLRIDPSTSTATTDEVRWQSSPDNAAWTTFGNVLDLVDVTDRHKRATGPVTAQFFRLVKIGGTDGGTDKFALDEVRLWTATANLSKVRLVSHTFSISQRYLMVFTDRNVEVFRNGVKQIDIPSPYTSALLSTTDATTGDITSINWSQSLDTLITVHEDVAPHRFFRDGADDEWNSGIWPINIKPSHPFDFVTPQTGTPTTATGDNIVFTAGAAMFVAADVGKFIRGNDGYAKIITFTSTTVVRMDIIRDFDSTDDIPAGEWSLEEDVWSVARGWPLSVARFQGRLYFAGSKSRPSSIWGSKAGNLLNFDIGDASANDAIDVTADTKDVVTFINIVAGRHLQFFGDSTEFYVPKSEDEGLTPTNFVLRKSTDRGSKRGLTAQSVDGATIFVQNEGKALREFLFTDTEQSYQANNISLLSSHLISNPIDISTRRSTSTDEADHILLVNDDGTLAVFTTLRDQNINAFTLIETEGDFLAVGVDRTDMYFCIGRTINGVERQYLEVFDNRLRVDAGIIAVDLGAPASTGTGLDHLDDETLKVILDDSIQPDLIPSGGSVTFARDAEDRWQVGLSWPDVREAEVTRLIAAGKTDAIARTQVYGEPGITAKGHELWIRDMPVEGSLPDGTIIGIKKRINSVTVRIKDTTGMAINDNPIAFQQFGSELLDQAIPDFTGDKTEGGLLGWDDFGQAEITQDAPYKLELLGIAKKVAV